MKAKSAVLGFTLVELLVTIAIIAILTVIGLPSLRGTLERNAVSGHVTSFIGALRFSRAEAIKRGLTVKMCRSVGAETAATPACATGSGDSAPGWATGWIIFIDRNDNGTVDANDVLLQVQGPLSSSGGVLASSATLVFNFRPTGLMFGAGAGQFTFTTASGDATRNRRVCVSVQGRARVAADVTTSCTTNDL